MCAPKSQGGKRCLRHSAGSTATVRYTEAKLKSVSREEIYENLKELNKEGRKLDAPSTTEVQSFLAKEKFKAQLDPDLEERERKLIVKNLEKAAAEAEEQGVSGGAFYAWKNLFRRTWEKAKRPFAALTLSTVLIGSLASCSGGDAPNAPEPNPSGSSISYTLDLGDGVDGPVVTDEWGDYQRVVVDPAGVPFNEDVVQKDTFEEVGLTMEDAKQAQESAVKYLIEDITDNPTFDIPAERFATEYKKWNDENYSRIYDGEWAKDSEAVTSGGIIAQLGGSTIRDGKPRIASVEVDVTSIVAYQTEKGGKGISVHATITTGYRVTDQFVKDGISSGFDLGDDTAGILEDGKPNVVTYEREAYVNIKGDKVSGFNFFPSNNADAWMLNNQKPSEF